MLSYCNVLQEKYICGLYVGTYSSSVKGAEQIKHTLE